ncbi:Lecithin:cholesterol acyltransferase-domain-containing protein [Suillus subalutaceus]|uniref:Lecithin:cholesterol acyltransferase-domain-containing protein n=1 Tax=Suillus subalutaceus TaxID=48586 RepID=UPI001B85C6A0|nr:Lecithin:cholesterol acyltransferase-domain-containing protein [Suillus subalutaceus]KAG1865905.1 Lecithin:cholesterol acyltransferase-domain-containing protein [Suillus subalutaceus]
MSTLSQRIRTWSASHSEAAKPPSEGDVGKEQDLPQLVHDVQLEATQQAKLFDAQIHKMKKERRFFVKARFLFPLGIILGILLGFILVQPSDLQDIHSNLLLIMEEYDISLKIPDIDLSRVELEWRRFRNNIPEVWKLNNDGREFQVGEAMKARGLTAHYPIVLIPGIVSTGLESWSTSPEYRAFFREKLWGGFNMVSQVIFNREKWISAMMLDPVTGLDPPGVKIRAAEGVGAASSFMTGYWLWSKIVENLAVVNYDTNNLHLAPYDWRLSMSNLEERDGYFSKLKATIEGFKARQGKKTVIAAHSMGSTVMLVPDILGCFKWVESPEHGGGGSDWVENHIESYITIAGTHLGVAKAMAAFLSGEMKDTVQMNPAGAYVLERFFSRKERQKLFCSWAGSASMWIKGGTDVWGDANWAPDDEPGSSHTHGELIAFRQASVPLSAHSITPSVEPTKNMTADDASTWILERTPSTFQKMLWTNYSFGIERNEQVLKKNALDPRKWTNPLEVQLPNAPSMRIICVYGHGKETERSYWYAHGPHEYEESFVEVEHSTCTDPTDKCNYARPPSDMSFSRANRIDADYTQETTTPKVRNGVKMGEGDGTVSLLSLGAMCAEGWKRPRWNPGGIKVTTVELPHQPAPNIPRGGANTSDHVDILGSTGLNELILKVATGAGNEIEDRFVSRIREFAQRVRWD